MFLYRATLNAVDAAIKARQWLKAVQMLAVLMKPEVQSYYKKIAQHHGNMGEYEVQIIFSISTFIVLYADDILLLAPLIVALQGLLRVCGDELSSLDMHINTKKSACLRIGPRHDKICATITTRYGCKLSWVDEIRYLGVFIVRSILNSNALLTMLNAVFAEQQMGFLGK